jgi:predicted lipid-binding transport protein (Tim44 family)
MNDSSLLEIILLAMVAGFVLLRLRAVLGRRIGHEQQNPPPVAPNVGQTEQAMREAPPPPVPAPMPLGGAVAAGLGRINAADKNFDPGTFIEGAKAAYEAIVTAFAAGNKAELRPLLADDVYNSFCQVIDQRNAAKETEEAHVVRLKAADIVDADLKDQTTAEITVKFVADLNRVTRNAEGQTIAGSAASVDEVTDIWGFARDVRTPDPNWLLIGTSVPA